MEAVFSGTRVQAVEVYSNSHLRLSSQKSLEAHNQNLLLMETDSLVPQAIKEAVFSISSLRSQKVSLRISLQAPKQNFQHQQLLLVEAGSLVPLQTN